MPLDRLRVHRTRIRAGLEDDRLRKIPIPSPLIPGHRHRLGAHRQKPDDRHHQKHCSCSSHIDLTSMDRAALAQPQTPDDDTRRPHYDLSFTLRLAPLSPAGGEGWGEGVIGPSLSPTFLPNSPEGTSNASPPEREGREERREEHGPKPYTSCSRMSPSVLGPQTSDLVPLLLTQHSSPHNP